MAGHALLKIDPLKYQHYKRLNMKSLPHQGQDIAFHEIHQDVQLSARQLTSLKLHSILNIMNVISGNLSLLALSYPDPELENIAALDREFFTILRNAEDVRMIDFNAYSLPKRRYLEQLEARAAGLDGAPQDGKTATIIKMIASFLDRLDETKDKILKSASQDEARWREFSRLEIEERIRRFLSDVARNSKGRYGVAFAPFANEPHENDYRVFIDIDSPEDKVPLPESFVDVLQDLIGNARKYTSPGGSISLRIYQHQSELMIEVRDTGRGIPEAEIADVVKFGFRASNIQQESSAGGFGMTKSYYLTKKNRGRMWIASAVEQGTCVRISLPLGG
jgi:signal transduction histidine kinase